MGNNNNMSTLNLNQNFDNMKFNSNISNDNNSVTGKNPLFY